MTQLSDNEWHSILDQALAESREKISEREAPGRLPVTYETKLVCSAIERIADAVIGAKKYGTLADKPQRPY